MKHFFSGMLIVLALLLALVLGVAALAESTDTETALPSMEDAPATTAPSQDATSSTTDSTALQDALNAYNSARQSSWVESIESELDGYVSSGKLTQEQADLILNYYREQQSLRNGTCPNCGYQFQNNAGYGYGGRMKGGKGGRGGFGGMRGFGQQMPGTQNDAQAGGTAYEGGEMSAPGIYGTEGI